MLRKIVSLRQRGGGDKNKRIVRIAAFNGAGVAAADAAEEKLFESKRGKGRDVKRQNILWVRM